MNLTTNYTTHTPPQPSSGTPDRPQRRFGIAATVGIAAAALLAGGLSGAALGVAASGPGDAAEACHAAVGHADDAMELYSDSLTLAADGIRGYSNDDPWAIREASDGLGTNSEDLYPVLEDYHTARLACFDE